MLDKFCDWLSQTSVSVAFQNTEWFVPSVQTVHILCIAIVMFSIYTIAFRLIVGTRGTRTLGAMVPKLLPWIWGALVVLLITGALLTITEPARELLNWAFRTKMIMVLVLAGLLLVIQTRMRHDPSYWSTSSSHRMGARAIGISMVLIGAAIVTAGRWIAYV